MNIGPPLKALLLNRYAELLKLEESFKAQLEQIEEEKRKVESAANAISVDLGDEISKHEEYSKAFDYFCRDTDETAKTSVLHTMKEAATIILDEARDGLTANEIRDAMKDRFHLDYLRSSLSPQLSRLKSEGVLSRKDGRWILTKYVSDLLKEAEGADVR